MRRVGLGATVTMATLLVVAACGGGDGSLAKTLGGGGEPASGTLVQGDAYRGVLLDAHLDYMRPADGETIEDVDSFVPTPDDVERFEAQLPAAVDTAANPGGDDVAADDLDGYVRQYTGVAAATSGRDDRHLVVAAICDSAAENGIEWQRGWVEVADGGTCFWDATMDLGSGEILRFGFHGSA